MPIDPATLKPAHDGTIEAGESLVASHHQLRAASIDWSQAPANATRYAARYNHYSGKTEAKWGAVDFQCDAPVFFEMDAGERGMAVTFGESQGAKEIVPQVRIKATLVEAESFDGETPTTEIQRMIDWSAAPEWATAWVSNHTAGHIYAYWIDDNEADMRHEDAPVPAGVVMKRGRVVAIGRPSPSFAVVK